MWRRLVAGTSMVIGAVMGCGVLAAADNGHGAAAVIGAFVLTSAAPIALGLTLWRRPGAPALPAPRTDSDAQAQLLRMAADRGGHLTAVEVFALTGVEPARAERLLDDLCRQGLAEHRVAADGSIVYRIRPLLTAAEKQRARGVLDDDER